MFTHRENALKRPSRYIIKMITLKKKSIQNLLKIYTKTHQICRFFLKFSRGGACPLTWVQLLISLFLSEERHFFILVKYALKRINYNMF